MGCFGEGEDDAEGIDGGEGVAPPFLRAAEEVGGGSYVDEQRSFAA